MCNKTYTIPEEQLFRLLEACANQNSCIDFDEERVKNTCKCYSEYCKEMTKTLIPNRNEKNIIN